MSLPVYANLAQFRCWTQAELEHRDMAQASIVAHVTRALASLNKAWAFTRVEAPLLIPRAMMSDAYTDDDIWTTPVQIAEQDFALRAETTPTTYAAIRALYPRKETLKFPHCFWQVGKSFRREPASTANRLRFFEFTQIEFQCLYATTTKADYRSLILPDLAAHLAWLSKADQHRIIDSDRLPAYSQSTKDVEVVHNDAWREIASVSLRTDFDPDVANLEIAIGLDRIVSIANPS